MASGGATQQVKSDHLKKVELMKEINQLNIKIQNFEKEKATHIYNKHGEFYKDFTQLQESDLKETRERKSEKVKLQHQLNSIKTKVKKFHRELKNVKPTPEFVEKLKVIMEEVEAQINSFKEQQREQYDEILREERVTQQEIQAVEKKIEMWAQQGAAALDRGAKPKPATITTARDITKDLPPEVAAFEVFVEESGGVRGGWDEYDHNTFLKYRVRHKGRPTFIRELIPALPTRSEHEVIEHERWYEQYLDLNEEKKEAIQKWKDRKEVEKESQMSQAAQDLVQVETEKRKQEEQRSRLTEEEKVERRVMLNRWKVEKELEKAEAEEQRLRQTLQKAKKRDQEKLRQEEQRQKVEEFKHQRELERQRKALEEEVRAEVEAEERRKHSQDISKFRTRDMQSVKRKLDKEREKQLEEKQKQERLNRLKSQVEVHVDRDPSRLLQPTRGWEERQKEPRPAGGGPLLHMPHRAVPTWRQGMS